MMTKRIATTLTPAASKRLIAKAVAQLPEVQHALTTGRIIIANGTTNAYVVEEIGLGAITKSKYTVGVITDAAWKTTPPEGRMKPIVLENGKVSDRPWTEVLEEFTAEDVFIKGGNAIDLEGNVGILLGSPTGGTIGNAFRTLVAKGSHLVLPIGLEKLIPSVTEAVSVLGIDKLDNSAGIPCGMFPVTFGTVITEIDAIHLLYHLESRHVCSGGVGGSEGAVGIVAWGNTTTCDSLLEDLHTMRLEPAIPKLQF